MITLVTGSNGQLGKTIQSIVKNNSEFIFTDINSLDITKKEKIESLIISKDINCIVNCAAFTDCLLYTSPSPRDKRLSRMPSSA